MKRLVCLAICLIFLFLSSSLIYGETEKELIDRGIACAKQGNFDEAISNFNKVIEKNPHIADAYRLRGNAYDTQGHSHEAISDFSKAIEIDPGFAPAYYDRAVAYCVKKEYDKAWDDIHKAEELGYRVNPRFLEDLKRDSKRDK